MLERRQKELELVEARYGEVERATDLSWFIVQRLPLRPGWSKSETGLLILLDPGYPETPPDNFHTDADLTLAGGSEPDRASGTIEHAGRRWRVFSWHFEDAKEWQPQAEMEHGHNLITFLLGVEQRLAELN